MAKVTAGVDLGGTKIQTVVLRGRKVVGSARELTPQSGTADIVASMAQTIRDSLEEASATITELDAIGIGAPGQIDGAEGVVNYSPNLAGFQKPVPLARLIARRLRGTPVVLDNDVRVAVLGEHKRGAGRPYKDLLGVFVGTGVGGGLVLGGKVRTGGGAAGEIGHTIVKDGGRPCSCGRRGHLESYAGRGRIEWAAKRLIKKGHRTVLFDLMVEKGRAHLSSGVIVDALKGGDQMVRKLIDEAVEALGIALSSTQNLLDVEAIIIGGGLGDRLGKSFVQRVRDEMQPRLFVPERAPVLLATELGDLSGAVGAAVLAGG